MMEVTIQVTPELLNSGQAITIRREDLYSGSVDYRQDNTSDINQRQVSEYHALEEYQSDENRCHFFNFFTR